jgi:hypothetical protein
MGILEIILFIAIFIWLIALSSVKDIATGALEELESRIEQLENGGEKKFSDPDFDADN